jgi:hypothetical protein
VSRRINTVRGVQVIKTADIILLEQPSERDFWKDFIGSKEVWYCPHGRGDVLTYQTSASGCGKESIKSNLLFLHGLPSNSF